MSFRMEVAEAQMSKTHGSGTNLLADAVLATDAAGAGKTIRVRTTYIPHKMDPEPDGMSRERTA